jgi:hypothetical protein
MGVTCSDLNETAGNLILESEKFPKLEIGDRCESSDYIDFITNDEMIHPIMYGVDKFQRNFIVFKLLIGGEIILQTFFQRYTDNIGFWRGCGHATKNPLLFNSTCSINEDVFDLLLSLMKGDHVKIENKHSPSFLDYIGKTITVFDQKKWDAAIIIQNYWKKCRYNPRYKMCERVQLRNLNDIMEEFGKESIPVN